MEFLEFEQIFQNHVMNILKDQSTLFIVNVDKDELWNLYLDSFPEGTNNIFRERREFDCSCCRHFIRSFGDVVTIENNKIISIWDFETNDSTYQPVIDSLSSFIHNSYIKDVFVTNLSSFGVISNKEQLPNKSIITWNHFSIKLPNRFVTQSTKSVASLTGEFRDNRNVFKRSLDVITKDSIETILDLIVQKSLYKGEEWNNILIQFLKIHNEYNELNNEKTKEIYCWKKSMDVGGVISKIKNHSIGVLLIDISTGVDLNVAVKRYEAIVAPSNYKRPKAIFTKKMIEQAQQSLIDMGLIDSLGRRHASIEDITINNIIFANKDEIKIMIGDVFAELQQEVVAKPKKFDKVEEVPVEVFVKDILPTMTNVELLFEGKHKSNLMSLIAPKIQNSKTLFKWDNNFSWAYNGNITDSMKERVKAAGGNVEGVLRFSLQWNENGDNLNDFDAHCVEPNENHIWFRNKRGHPSNGMLDVDIINPNYEVAVENITWTSINKMQEGIYKFYVNNYSHRGGRSGFTAEIEYDRQIYSYSYNKDIRVKENVNVATIKFSKRDGIKFIESLDSQQSSQTIWGLQTNKFQPLSVCMFSPNYWDEQSGIGNKHYFFLMNNCINEDQPNGFFNEFLREEFMKYKRVFEALGSKMRVDYSNNQLSGLGFSSTKRNSLIVKGEGRFTRMVKVLF